MSHDQDVFLQEFCTITGADIATGHQFLEISDWDLEAACRQFFQNEEVGAVEEGPDDDDDDDELFTVPGQPPPPPVVSSSAGSSSANPKPKPRSRDAKVRTLGDLGSGSDSADDEDESKKKRDLFAGGEKSGLAVQDPGDPGASGHGNLIQDILRRAAEGGRNRQPEEPASPPATRFSGAGHTLGSDTAESVTVPDPHASAAPPVRQSVTRALTFWRDGFSVEDGPLMRYEDPANQEILQAIESGRAPLHLMNVEPGQPADVNVFKRMDEDYTPPKKKFVPFGGQGQRLGSLAPGESIRPSPPAAAAAAAAPGPAPAPAAAAAAAPLSVNVDSSEPTTSLQIRLGDGRRLISRFNHSHTVGDLYSFVEASGPESRSRSFVLQTTFPRKELQDRTQTLKDASLINTVVVQRWSP